MNLDRGERLRLLPVVLVLHRATMARHGEASSTRPWLALLLTMTVLVLHLSRAKSLFCFHRNEQLWLQQLWT